MFIKRLKHLILYILRLRKGICIFKRDLMGIINLAYTPNGFKGDRMRLLTLCQAINRLELSIQGIRRSIGYHRDRSIFRCQCYTSERKKNRKAIEPLLNPQTQYSLLIALSSILTMVLANAQPVCIPFTGNQRSMKVCLFIYSFTFMYFSVSYLCLGLRHVQTIFFVLTDQYYFVRQPKQCVA